MKLGPLTSDRLSLLSMSQTNTQVPHLFECWNQISERIRAAKDIRIFLDFDGTLVPFCPEPDDVKLPEAARRVLKKLATHSRVHVALVSGRRNAALRKYIRIPKIQLLGLYGWEKKGGLVLPARTRRALPSLRSVVKSVPAEFPGIRFEDKGVSFGIHFRGAPSETIHRARAWTRKLLVRVRKDFRVIQTSSAWEIVPRQVEGKGAALREFVKSLRRPFLPIYIGDDLTDEPAFSALRRGITIRVGSGVPTMAHFWLKDPEEVRIFLERLTESIA